MPTQLVEMALVDSEPLTRPDDTKDFPVIVKFGIYQEGAENASRQAVYVENNSMIIENNRELYTSKTFTVEVVGIFSQSDRDQVFAWSKARTPLYITGYSVDGHILYAYGQITVTEGYGDNASMRFRFQNASNGSYDENSQLHTSNMVFSRNITNYIPFQKPPDYDNHNELNSNRRPALFRNSKFGSGEFEHRGAYYPMVPRGSIYNGLTSASIFGIDPDEPNDDDPTLSTAEYGDIFYYWDDTTNSMRIKCDGYYERTTKDPNGNDVVEQVPYRSYSYAKFWFPFPNVTVVAVGEIINASRTTGDDTSPGYDSYPFYINSQSLRFYVNPNGYVHYRSSSSDYGEYYFNTSTSVKGVVSSDAQIVSAWAVVPSDEFSVIQFTFGVRSYSDVYLKRMHLGVLPFRGFENYS